MLPKVVQYMVNDKLRNPGNPICVRPLCVLDNGGVSECYIAIVVQVQVFQIRNCANMYMYTYYIILLHKAHSLKWHAANVETFDWIVPIVYDKFINCVPTVCIGYS